jgi:hypothetical protein
MDPGIDHKNMRDIVFHGFVSCPLVK